MAQSMAMALSPARRCGWRSLAVRLAALLILLGAGIAYIFHMPEESHTGPLPPLTAAEARIRAGLAAHVEMLAGTIGERNVWRYPALLEAADYIEQTLAAVGYRPTDDPLESQGKPVRNVIAELPGHRLPKEIVLVGAHYDTVSGSPGANDNGSGVAALLELARLLREREVPRTVRFVAFVNEEAPFFGTDEMGSLTHARAARARGEDVRAMLSLETIGYYSDAPDSQHYPFPLSYFYPQTANFIGFVGNVGSRRLVHDALASFRRHARFPSEGAAVPASIDGVGWSDHWAFWEAGYEAIMLTDTAFFRYAHYHTGDDTPDKVDYERLARVVAGLAEVIADLAGGD
jgi:Zn-dependent M28 family amino/carboxypeptidase